MQINIFVYTCLFAYNLHMKLGATVKLLTRWRKKNSQETVKNN